MNEVKSINQLPFTDLFLGADLGLCGFKSTSDAFDVKAIPPALVGEAQKIFSVLEKSETRGSDYMLHWEGEDGTPPLEMRVKQLPLGNGQPLYALRRYAVNVPDLSETGMPAPYVDWLSVASIKSGLVLLIGRPGSGKTTTACAIIKARLTAYGGVAWTVENPIELPLQGRHGKGICYQTSVDDDRDIPARMRDFYRATPNLLFVGEIRTREVAIEVITAAGSGSLVFATLHGFDLVSGLRKLNDLVGTSGSPHVLADVLRMAMHLQLHQKDADELKAIERHSLGPGLGTPPRVLVCTPLFLFDDENDKGIRSKLREGQYHLLSSEIGAQQRKAEAHSLSSGRR